MYEALELKLRQIELVKEIMDERITTQNRLQELDEQLASRLHIANANGVTLRELSTATDYSISKVARLIQEAVSRKH